MEAGHDSAATCLTIEIRTTSAMLREIKGSASSREMPAPPAGRSGRSGQRARNIADRRRLSRATTTRETHRLQRLDQKRADVGAGFAHPFDASRKSSSNDSQHQVSPAPSRGRSTRAACRARTSPRCCPPRNSTLPISARSDSRRPVDLGDVIVDSRQKFSPVATRA